jgi:secreted trypsin-like serine protease
MICAMICAIIRAMIHHMIRLLAFLPILYALLAPAAALVGGAQPADETLARHVVMVVGGHRTGCTGTAIAQNLILTAAHCVPPGERYGVFEAGASRRGKPNSVASIERNPLFDLETAFSGGETADVALLKLAEPLTKRMAAAPFAAREYFPIGERFIVAGYGITEQAAGGYGTLRAATLMVVRHTASGALRLADPMTRGEMGGLGACNGDSGGPVLDDSSGRFTLVGVVSWATDARSGAGCGGLTGVVPLPHFRTWLIEASMKFGSPVQP